MLDQNNYVECSSNNGNAAKSFDILAATWTSNIYFNLTKLFLDPHL